MGTSTKKLIRKKYGHLPHEHQFLLTWWYMTELRIADRYKVPQSRGIHTPMWFRELGEMYGYNFRAAAFQFGRKAHKHIVKKEP